MAKHDLIFDPPVMNAPGTLGFAPEIHSSLDWTNLGAFVTNPISYTPRTPANGARFTTYPGGFLLHTGYPNPGLTRILRSFTRRWSRSSLSVIVHLLARGPEEVGKMVRQLETVAGISGLELGIASEAGVEEVTSLKQAACSELPVIAQLPIERSIELAEVAVQAGAMAVSLAPPRGSLPIKNRELVRGRLYGPAILPIALRIVRELAQPGIPIIGAGGIVTLAYVKTMLDAGASAVQLDYALWRGAGY